MLNLRGDFAKVWLAAHLNKNINKAQILKTNIVESVDSILQPKNNLSFKISSALLLAIVRIYARKTLYLLQDCQDAYFEIKSANWPEAIDLPDGMSEASINAITLPDMLEFIDYFDLIDKTSIQMREAGTRANIRRITLIEDISSNHVEDPLMQDVRNWLHKSFIHGSEKEFTLEDSTPSIGRTGNKTNDSFDWPELTDGFSSELGVGIGDENDVLNIQMSNIQPMEPEDQQQKVPETQTNSVALQESAWSNRLDNKISYGGQTSMTQSGPPSTSGSETLPPAQEEKEKTNFAYSIQKDGLSKKRSNETQDPLVMEPLDDPSLEQKQKRYKKVGKLIDQVKKFSNEEIQTQMSDITDIITTFDFAPHSKKLMHWKKMGTSQIMFALPEREMPSDLLIYYTRYLSTSHVDTEETLREPDLMNGDFSRHEQTLTQEPSLSDLEVIEKQLPQLSPIPDLDSPKTPKTPSYTRMPPKKLRKIEDEKECKEKAQSDFEEPFEMSASDYTPIQQIRACRLLTSVHFRQMQPLDEIEDNDYGALMSLESLEEMLYDETDEQIEERIHQKSNNLLLNFIVTQIEEKGQILFSDLVKNNKRKQVAQKFFSLLVLKKQLAIELTQDTGIPYANIIIGKILHV